MIRYPPIRRFFADQEWEALSFAEEGGISVRPAPFGYVVYGRRRRLIEWAKERGYQHENLQLPTVTGVWHINLAGETARRLAAELGIDLEVEG